MGTKNTLLDGSMTLNTDAFYYKYQNYQISQIVDRTSVNLNFNATVRGAELESTWEPIPGLRFNFAGGYENTALANGSQAIDLMDRTAGNSSWMLVRPYPTQTSSCVVPTAVVNQVLSAFRAENGGNNSTPASAVPGNNLYFDGDGPQALSLLCIYAYGFGIDPGTPFGISTGFNPATAPNNGEGFAKNLSGNQLPNAPPFTLSAGAQYSKALRADWAGTLRADGGTGRAVPSRAYSTTSPMISFTVTPT